MQLQLPFVLAFIASARAVIVCDAFNSAGQDCAGTCTDRFIAIGETLNVPGTQCIKNAKSDAGFDLTICNQFNLEGICSDLGQQPRSTIGDNFVWKTPGTQSIKRTGN
jgi:hypothetical protein